MDTVKPSSSSLSSSSSSSSQPPLPPSSSSSQPCTYDVFLSFRGEDTRRTFTDHLYAALDRAGVRTFRDADGLRRGENIERNLKEIIQGCRTSLIVFSENYGDSTWCLEELVEIMDCRITQRQRVLPIFYRVDPSDVRKQTGSFGKAFEKHEGSLRKLLTERGSFKKTFLSLTLGEPPSVARKLRKGFSKNEIWLDQIARWRAALKGAANLAGFNIADRHEAEFISSIVDEICRQLTSTYLNLAVYPVGIDSRVEDITNLLSIGVSDDVRMIGIWGMGGIGKTTLAKAIYNKYYHDFDSKSLLADVRETAKDSCGKITLQERLLSDILRPAKIVVDDVSRGVSVIKERLGSKRVLVIVDDVDDVDQLNALAIRRDSFGRGSRIIITTRDRHLLELLEVDGIHLTQEMNEDEAFELFTCHAFQNQCPDDDYTELSRRVVSYCGGLPLALEVLGSFLFKRSIGEWKSILKKLKRTPHVKIQSKLRISFDALDDFQKNIFLHICCFFIGMDKEHVRQILIGCGFFADIEICVLIQRCLVTVSEKNKLIMHDLLRDMGREVVREESPNRPERRSRLWRQEDVIDVLTDESGTEETEGLALNLQRSDDNISVSTEAFRNMKRLELLQLNYVRFIGDCYKFSKKLRWLCLRGFSPQVLRNEFVNAPYLVSIDLQCSNLRIWEYSRLLVTVKILNLSHSHYLTQSPDFSNLLSLEYLIMKDCKRLSEMHESVGYIYRLAVLNLKDCIMLEDLPQSIYRLKSVKTLVFSGCSRLKNLDENIGKLRGLTTFLVNGTSIREIPSSVEKLPHLSYSSKQKLKEHVRVVTAGPS